MRGAWPSILLLFLALAGCTGDGGGDADETVPAAAASSTSSAPAAPIALPDEVVLVSWDGATGTYAYAREATTGQQVSQRPVDGTNGFIVERPGMTLVAADLALTWTAATPVSQTLTFDLMVMGPNSTMVGSISGPSGIAISASGLALPLDNQTVVHAYFYNPTVFVNQSPLVAGAALDQAAHVEGTLTFRPLTG